MNKVQRMLMIVFWSNVVVVAIVILTGETNFMPYDRFKGDTKTEFYLLTIMELLTICIIPLALRLFKFNKVNTDLLQKREQALARWGIIRLDMLCLPMFINAVLYYVYMHAAFGYLAIILFICLFFVYPSMSRCQSEVEEKP